MCANIQRTSCVFTAVLSLFLLTAVYAEKYKLCVVDGRGGFKRSGKYCPTLDKPDSRVECVLGIDRLDCLRKISKGQADFSVFTPEDLVTATNSEIEVLLTDELRYTDNKFEYEVVAVTQNSARIRSRHDLKGKRFCHPGYGYETDWTRILANYLEASIIPQMCNTKLTITENRIKASSEFFNSACKAGPWVNNPKLNLELKSKYPNLCALCDNPTLCEISDKYWGRRGSLFCLTDGAGDISWARLDDVRLHFGLVPGNNESTPEGYSFLCPDGTSKPLNSTNPCVWVVKPWPVVATKRTAAQDIQEFLSTLTNVDSDSWQGAVLHLIENFHLTITKLQPIEPIETFLEKATGFLNANSFSGCHPPRTIRVCTTSIIENAKCAWLRESAAVYGIEPDLECLKADNTTHCMDAVANNAADIVMVPPDLLNPAMKKYNLSTLFYETVNDDGKYLTIAITRNDTTVNKLTDLQGYKACFPSYDGVAWNTVAHSLHQRKALNSCPVSAAVKNFFGASCIPGLPGNEAVCDGNSYRGDMGALQCLIDRKGDVAFISKNSLPDFINSPILNYYGSIQVSTFNVMCEQKSEGCHLSWAPAGQAMIRANTTDLWFQDTLDVFLQIDNLFGRNHKSFTTPLQLFGPYNGKSNILFHDSTIRLRSVPRSRNFDTMQRLYQEDILPTSDECVSSASIKVPLVIGILTSYLFIYIFK
ncbi:transferrin [Zophobas morio]|uniref:transferrin n=1 Tax=Zophobas morio TaxID=2755281 RepID=UPI003083979C